MTITSRINHLEDRRPKQTDGQGHERLIEHLNTIAERNGPPDPLLDAAEVADIKATIQSALDRMQNHAI